MRVVKQDCRTDSVSHLRLQGGKNLFASRDKKFVQSFALFNSLIESITRAFHKFRRGVDRFAGLESTTWSKCKNMLPVVVNVATMLTVRSACSIDVVQEPSCFHRLTGQNHFELSK
jgi:hypothetical protein